MVKRNMTVAQIRKQQEMLVASTNQYGEIKSGTWVWVVTRALEAPILGVVVKYAIYGGLYTVVTTEGQVEVRRGELMLATEEEIEEIEKKQEDAQPFEPLMTDVVLSYLLPLLRGES
jgi:hypothetical protein